jgi:acyl-CoA synthetase (NDP forming)
MGGEEFANIARDAVHEISKPVVISLINPIASLLRDYELLMGSGIPVYPDPMRAANSLAKLAEYAEFRQRCD